MFKLNVVMTIVYILLTLNSILSDQSFEAYIRQMKEEDTDENLVTLTEVSGLVWCIANIVRIILFLLSLFYNKSFKYLLPLTEVIFLTQIIPQMVSSKLSFEAVLYWCLDFILPFTLFSTLKFALINAFTFKIIIFFVIMPFF